MRRVQSASDERKRAVERESAHDEATARAQREARRARVERANRDAQPRDARTLAWGCWGFQFSGSGSNKLFRLGPTVRLG